MSTAAVKEVTFEAVMESLISRNSTKLKGNYEWIDWDAIYSELLDEGYPSDEASILLDKYIAEYDGH
jgi:hypothetical protein